MRYAAVTLAVATLLIVTIVAAEAAVLDYKVIASAPPIDFVTEKIGCRPGFGQPWNDRPKGMSMTLGYYQGQLIAQHFKFTVNDIESKKNWNDLKFVEGAPVKRVTFGAGQDATGPSYHIVVFYVDMEKVKEVCPTLNSMNP